MNLLERLLTWLWDRTGKRRAELDRRDVSMNQRLAQLRASERRALDQIRRTQEFVRAHRGQY